MPRRSPLHEALASAESLPFLFVGSGASIRYHGHPNWRELLDWAATLIGRPLAYYLGRANGDLPLVATFIAADLYERWWTDPVFEASRTAWSDHVVDELSPLKIEISLHLRSIPLIRRRGLTRELTTLASAKIDGIITTNYDELLEGVFPNYEVFTGQDDLLLRRSYELGEIYKIHGTVARPNTLVLGQADYHRFDRSSTYLVAKLMSVFIEHPIVFLGYSLSDRNIRTIFAALVECITSARLDLLTDRFIFIDYDPAVSSPRTATFQLDLGEGRLLPVLRVRTATYQPIFNELAGLDRRLPVELLRRVKRDVVEIVHSTRPEDSIEVDDLAAALSNPDLKTVVGIGNLPHFGARGLVGLRRQDLIRDTVANDGGWIPTDVVNAALPEIVRQHPTAWTPVHKYVAQSGLSETETPASVVAAVRRKLEPPLRGRAVRASTNSPEDLVATHGLPKALTLILSQAVTSIDLDGLERVLAGYLPSTGRSFTDTTYAKAVVLYGRLRYPVSWE